MAPPPPLAWGGGAFPPPPMIMPFVWEPDCEDVGEGAERGMFGFDDVSRKEKLLLMAG